MIFDPTSEKLQSSYCCHCCGRNWFLCCPDMQLHVDVTQEDFQEEFCAGQSFEFWINFKSCCLEIISCHFVLIPSKRTVIMPNFFWYHKKWKFLVHRYYLYFKSHTLICSTLIRDGGRSAPPSPPPLHFKDLWKTFESSLCADLPPCCATTERRGFHLGPTANGNLQQLPHQSCRMSNISHG